MPYAISNQLISIQITFERALLAPPTMPGDKFLQMDAVKTRIGRLLSNAPGRLYRGLPSILLGTLFNVLDAGTCNIFFISAK